MDKIEHKYIVANGVKLHVAEIGNGSNVVLFCHGFPEIWYSWRYQMIAVANAGYRAISLDYRGFGLSEVPDVPENTTCSDVINDLYSLLDVLRIPRVCMYIYIYIFLIYVIPFHFPSFSLCVSGCSYLIRAKFEGLKFWFRFFLFY